LHFQEADYILQASHKEGSGYSITEALSCGLIPILSDIPSFRLLSREGELGGLFDQGNASSLKKALVGAFKKNREEQRKLVKQHYRQNFSSMAIAKKLVLIYNNMLGK
jgi:glycosyltransferase involved in cell wall biosynthesis